MIFLGPRTLGSFCEVRLSPKNRLRFQIHYNARWMGSIFGDGGLGLVGKWGTRFHFPQNLAHNGAFMRKVYVNMSDLNSGASLLSLEDEKISAIVSGVISAVSGAILIFVPISSGQGIFLGLAILGFLLAFPVFIFSGSTIISMALTGVARFIFQVAVVVVIPLLLSLYFIKDSSSITLQEILGDLVNLSTLIWVGIIFWASLATSDYLDQVHPFRGFLIACALLFFICFLGHNGATRDVYNDVGRWGINNEKAKQNAQTGAYMSKFLVYVGVSYFVMFKKMRQRSELQWVEK